MNTKHAIEILTVVTQAGSVVSADIDDGETVMMSVEQGMYYGMNDIGSHIWKLMEHPLSVPQLCDALLERFNVTREVCQRDVLDFLHELHEDGLIEICNPD